jgi:hypothetical protein
MQLAGMLHTIPEALMITTIMKRLNSKSSLPKAISRFNLSSAEEDLVIMLDKASNDLQRRHQLMRKQMAKTSATWNLLYALS